jgi:hypothetical protein
MNSFSVLLKEDYYNSSEMKRGGEELEKKRFDWHIGSNNDASRFE